MSKSRLTARCSTELPTCSSGRTSCVAVECGGNRAPLKDLQYDSQREATTNDKSGSFARFVVMLRVSILTSGTFCVSVRHQKGGAETVEMERVALSLAD